MLEGRTSPIGEKLYRYLCQAEAIASLVGEAIARNCFLHFN